MIAEQQYRHCVVVCDRAGCDAQIDIEYGPAMAELAAALDERDAIIVAISIERGWSALIEAEALRDLTNLCPGCRTAYHQFIGGQHVKATVAQNSIVVRSSASSEGGGSK